MKKVLFIAVLVFLATNLKAQTNDSIQSNESKYQYCEVVGSTSSILSTKVRIQVDYGQEVSFWNQYSKRVIKEEDGKAIKFNSMIDALNYMGTQGWEFVQAYAVTMGNTNVYHFLMKRKLE